MIHIRYIACLLTVLFGAAAGSTFIVAQSGGDFNSIQAALNAAVAGDSVLVKEKSGYWQEKIIFPRSGNPQQGPIILSAYPGHQPVLDGTGVSGKNMIAISSKSYLHISGLELQNNLNVNDGSGIRITGSGSHIELVDNVIHDIRGQHAMAITVYGTESTAVSALLIEGNQIYDCEPAQSEALTLNGNVRDFIVRHNTIRDVNNIGIDFIGGETSINPDTTLVAREGICCGNTVLRANSNYGGGYAAGIYVDGGRDIVIENNIVSGCDLGIEIGAENYGSVTRGIIVRSNLVFRNEKCGIIFGGYASYTGRVRNCVFSNNTCFYNDLLNEGWGELVIQYASYNTILNNIFYSTSQSVMLYSETGNFSNSLDYNLWFSSAGISSMEFIWNGNLANGLPAFQNLSGQESNGTAANPEFQDSPNNDLHIEATSPAIDRGDPAYTPAEEETDIDGEARLSGSRVDIGADEWTVQSGLIHIDPEWPVFSRLDFNYPNPFNNSTTIAFYLACDCRVSLKIFSAAGELVATLADSPMSAGKHFFRWNSSRQASGSYFCTLSTGNSARQTTQMILLR